MTVPRSVPRRPLSPRELEILALVEAGRSNPEIAAALRLSPHTVKSHMVRITAALGVQGRIQATAWAARRDVAADVSAEAVEELLALAESVAAGKPLSLLRGQAVRALASAGRRGPVGRPLVDAHGRRQETK